MQNRIARVAGWFWPALADMPASRQVLGAGDRMLLYTDGIPEARKGKGE